MCRNIHCKAQHHALYHCFIVINNADNTTVVCSIRYLSAEPGRRSSEGDIGPSGGGGRAMRAGEPTVGEETPGAGEDMAEIEGDSTARGGGVCGRGCVWAGVASDE